MSDYSELAEEAFEDSPEYEFKGIPLYFSYRHYYAMLAMMKDSEMSYEEQVLLVFWIATHTPENIKNLRKKWRKNKELVFEEFEQMPEIYNLTPGSQDTLDIAEIASKIWSDIENSADVVSSPKDNKKSEVLAKK